MDVQCIDSPAEETGRPYKVAEGATREDVRRERRYLTLA